MDICVWNVYKRCPHTHHISSAQIWCPVFTKLKIFCHHCDNKGLCRWTPLSNHLLEPVGTWRPWGLGVILRARLGRSSSSLQWTVFLTASVSMTPGALGQAVMGWWGLGSVYWAHTVTTVLNFPGGSDGKASAYNEGGPGSVPGLEEPLEKEMATHSSILAWKIPWTEERCRLQCMGSQRDGHDWATSLSLSLSQQTVENVERDGNTRPPDLPPKKSVCRSTSNS